MRTFAQKKGLIALTTLILLSAILMVSGIAFVYTSISLSKSTTGFAHKSILETATISCLEESLLRIKNDVNYTSPITITNDDYSCTAEIAIVANTRNISIVSTREDNTLEDTYTIDISTNPFTVVE